MEPSDLNSPASDDRLESLLRQPAAPLPDDGFSARVLCALPPPPPARQAWPRRTCYLVGTLAGVIYLTTRDVDWSATSTATDQLAAMMVQIADSLSAPAVVLAFSITVLSLAVAFHAELRESLEA